MIEEQWKYLIKMMEVQWGDALKQPGLPILSRLMYSPACMNIL